MFMPEDSDPIRRMSDQNRRNPKYLHYCKYMLILSPPGEPKSAISPLSPMPMLWCKLMSSVGRNCALLVSNELPGSSCSTAETDGPATGCWYCCCHLDHSICNPEVDESCANLSCTHILTHTFKPYINYYLCC